MAAAARRVRRRGAVQAEPARLLEAQALEAALALNAETYDVAVVGGGHNGLVAAAYCAQAGLRTILLERAPVLGGATLTEEVWPGYRVSVASYVCSLLDPRVIADLDLIAHGFEAYRKDPASFTPLADGRSLLLGTDDAANAREIAAFDPRDVAGLAAFEREATRLGALLAESFADPAPSLANFDEATQKALLGSAAALVERHVRTPVLQATLATDGLIGTAAGPRDPGTAYVLAHHYAGRAMGAQGAWGFVRGGMGALARAIAAAARKAGASLRTDAEAAHIHVRNGRAESVELVSGERIAARAILVGAAPQTLFLKLLDPGDAPPALRRRAETWRANGMAFKLNLALGGVPEFTARPGAGLAPQHRATIHVAPSLDYLQRAFDDTRSGISRDPMLECFMQTPTEPDLAPAGKHVMSVFAQYFPYARNDRPWTAEDRAIVADRIVATLAQYAPNLPALIDDRQMLAAPDLETRIGLPGGHIFHGELLPDQIYEFRFPVRAGIPGLYLCGSGTHPGGCVSGFPGRRGASAAIADARVAATA